MAGENARGRQVDIPDAHVCYGLHDQVDHLVPVAHVVVEGDRHAVLQAGALNGLPQGHQLGLAGGLRLDTGGGAGALPHVGKRAGEMSDTPIARNKVGHCPGRRLPARVCARPRQPG